MPRTAIRTLIAILLPLALTLPAVAPARADDGKIKQGFKDAGEGIKSLGKKIGEKSAEAGHEIAGVAKRIWYKGKKVSAPLLHDVQRSTRRFWDDVIKGKDKTIDGLKDENERMKKDLDEGNH